MLTQQNQAVAPDGLPFNIISLRNANGTVLDVMDWGATWLSCHFPLADGEVRNVVLGCAKPEDYLRQKAFLGATVGRYANRIANATLNNHGHPIALVANQDQHQLHGGPNSFDKRRWKILNQSLQQVTLHITSEDGDCGFPGNLVAEVSYTLTDDNRVEICYRAKVDRSCPINFTNHAYFNLEGEAAGDVRNHKLQIFADTYLPVDTAGIPTAGLTRVDGSGMDFRQPKRVMQDFLQDHDQQLVSGYDHAFLLKPECHSGEKPAAILWSPDNKVQLTVYTDKPAVQFYSGNFLAGAVSHHGEYENFAGLALESEFLPDSPNHPEWPQPDCWLKPEDEYRSTTVYQLTAL